MRDPLATFYAPTVVWAEGEAESWARRRHSEGIDDAIAASRAEANRWTGIALASAFAIAIPSQA